MNIQKGSRRSFSVHVVQALVFEIVMQHPPSARVFQGESKGRVSSQKRIKATQRARFHPVTLPEPIALLIKALEATISPSVDVPITSLHRLYAAGGLVDVITQPGVSGMLYPAGDYTAAAKMTAQLVADKDMQQRMGAMARAEVGSSTHVYVYVRLRTCVHVCVCVCTCACTFMY